MKYGYARVSSKDQDLSIQLQVLKDAGCDMIRSEKLSARSLNDREELKVLLQFLRSGDTLIVTRVDRLARSVRDLSNIVHDLADRGIGLIALQQQLIQLTRPAERSYPCWVYLRSLKTKFAGNVNPQG